MDNTLNQSFHDRLRDERLSQHCFLSLGRVRAVTEGRRAGYNRGRSYGALSNLTPS
jgi:hypothetical protein